MWSTGSRQAVQVAALGFVESPLLDLTARPGARSSPESAALVLFVLVLLVVVLSVDARRRGRGVATAATSLAVELAQSEYVDVAVLALVTGSEQENAVLLHHVELFYLDALVEQQSDTRHVIWSKIRGLWQVGSVLEINIIKICHEP